MRHGGLKVARRSGSAITLETYQNLPAFVPASLKAGFFSVTRLEQKPHIASGVSPSDERALCNSPTCRSFRFETRDRQEALTLCMSTNHNSDRRQERSAFAGLPNLLLRFFAADCGFRTRTHPRGQRAIPTQIEARSRL